MVLSLNRFFCKPSFRHPEPSVSRPSLHSGLFVKVLHVSKTSGPLPATQVCCIPSKPAVSSFVCGLCREKKAASTGGPGWPPCAKCRGTRTDHLRDEKTVLLRGQELRKRGRPSVQLTSLGHPWAIANTHRAPGQWVGLFREGLQLTDPTAPREGVHGTPTAQTRRLQGFQDHRWGPSGSLAPPFPPPIRALAAEKTSRGRACLAK